jgi:hypothetical protein
MNMRTYCGIIFAVLLVSCGRTKSAFMTIEFCVHDRAGFAELVSDLQDIARTNHMEFFDSSTATARDLSKSGYRGRERSDGSPVINVGVLRNDGLFVGGGNLGLPGYQIQLGFTAGSDNVESNRFAMEVVARLRRQWPVSVLPPGSAARPMSDCR